MNSLQAVRGMNDVLPDRVHVWQALERTLADLFAAYDYREIRLPIVEKTELFARSIGEDTDIVAKEMYSFTDRNGDSLTLRPEGTASCVRAGVQHGLFHNRQQRLWYLGPMFRHERPQRGRYRQFHQAGAEAIGWPGPDIDAELIAITARLWRTLEIPAPALEINSLGDRESRRRYRQRLIAYLTAFVGDLDPDSARRLDTNPLRILDTKNERTREILADAPSILDALDSVSRAHLETLCAHLDACGIDYRINPRLVRGLDYYDRAVFEWVTDELGAQGTVCAGGRYDGLVEQLGGKPVPAAGFALGLERLVELIQTREDVSPDGPHVYLVSLGDAARRAGLRLSEQLRDAGVTVRQHCGEGGLKNQLKHADRSGAKFAILLGDDEMARATVTLKPLRSGGDQQEIPFNELIMKLPQLIDKAIVK